MGRRRRRLGCKGAHGRSARSHHTLPAPCRASAAQPGGAGEEQLGEGREGVEGRVRYGRHTRTFAPYKDQVKTK